MSGISWTKFFWSRYWAKTRHFTSGAQHGIYMNLLGANMTTGPLSSDHASLRGLAACTQEEWDKYGPEIIGNKKFFSLYRGKLYNQLAMDVRRDAMKRIADEKKRAKAGANARWGGDNEPDLPFESEVESAPEQEAAETSPLDDEVGGWGEEAPTVEIDPDADMRREAIDLYNATAEKYKLAKVQKLTRAREGKLNRRLIECGGIEGWKAALEKIETIPGLRGANKNNWRADFDFLLQQSSFTKLMEGSYDHWKGNGVINGHNGAQHDDDKAAILSGVGIGHVGSGVQPPASNHRSPGSARPRNRSV